MVKMMVMHDIEYDRESGEKYLKIHDHPELFKHFIIPVADRRGITFWITRPELKIEGGYYYADVPGKYGVGGVRYSCGAIFVSITDTFWDRVFKNTFEKRCDFAVEKLEKVCALLDEDIQRWVREYRDSVIAVKRFRIKRLSVPRDIRNE